MMIPFLFTLGTVTLSMGCVTARCLRSRSSQNIAAIDQGRERTSVSRRYARQYMRKSQPKRADYSDGTSWQTKRKFSRSCAAQTDLLRLNGDERHSTAQRRREKMMCPSCVLCSLVFVLPLCKPLALKTRQGRRDKSRKEAAADLKEGGREGKENREIERTDTHVNSYVHAC